MLRIAVFAMMGTKRLKTGVQAGAMTTVRTEVVIYLLMGIALCLSVSVRGQAGFRNGVLFC